VEAGDYLGARPLFERALAVQEAALGHEHELVGNTLNNLANLISDMGDYPGSKPMYDRALRIKEKVFGTEAHQLMSTLINEAILLRLMGDFTGGRALAERAIAIGKAKLRPGHPKMAVALETLASILQETGDISEARRIHEQVLAVREKELPAGHPDRATSLASLGSLSKLSGDLTTAMSLLEKAFAIQEESLERDSAYMASTVVQMGEVSRRMGDVGKARQHFERSIRILEQSFGAFHPDLSTSLELLASLPDTPQSESIELRKRALSIREESLGPTHPLVAVSLIGLAEALHGARRSDEAFEMARHAEQIGRDHLRLTAGSLADTEALRYAAHRPSGLDLMIRIAEAGQDQRLWRDAWDEVIRSRALVLDDMAWRHRNVIESGEPGAATALMNLRTARSKLGALAARGPAGLPVESYRALLQQAAAEAEAAERALAGRSSSFRESSRAARAGLVDVSAALPADSTLVGWVRTGFPARYVAFLLTAGGSPLHLNSLGSADRMDSLIARWRGMAAREPPPITEAARVAEEEYRRVALELREALWDTLPLAARSTRRVFVVSEGALTLVNLATLTGMDGRYLVEDGPLIHVLSAERDLLAQAASLQAADDLLAIGGPDFERRQPGNGPASTSVKATASTYRGTTSRCEGFESLRFDPLEAAAAEAMEIEKAWTRARKGSSGGSRSLTGAQAVEESFKALAPSFRIVHVASHGFFLDDECDDAGSPLAENPLLRAGLAFAGANRRSMAGPDQDDGILTAEEIASLDLSRVEWLVLSACDTALGKTQPGEGVLGLRRAARVSGARALIMSLWRVKDDAARDWMKRLYAHRSQGVPTDEALRNASLDVLNARRGDGDSTHPFYWGAFVATGDWR
jgi:CHAT domain-containing protein/tetratricopeptide (TPR) repeat protein